MQKKNKNKKNIFFVVVVGGVETVEKCLKRPNIAKSFQQSTVDKLWKNVENFRVE